jgi:coenzyme F420 hydrogenase subunit beta
MDKINIKHVVETKLCTSCGACSVACKFDAIFFRETVAGYFFPYIIESTCNNCGSCLSVCTGIHFSNNLRTKASEEPFTGPVIDSFVGKATNKFVYENSQSGGIVTAIAINALESNMADAMITVVMDWGNPARPKAVLARTKNDILLSQKSKYCPIPTLSVLKEVIGSNQRIVFVGTPCQVHGLFNLIELIPSLKNNIKVIIGLVCDRVMTYAALDYLVSQANRPINSEHHLTFRDKMCGGYPGNVHIRFSKGQNRVMPSSARMQIKDYFTPARCRICFDKMNICADIVVGDPHGIEPVDRCLGESMVVVRTETGQSFLQSALKDRAINLRPVCYQQVLDGQFISDKKLQWSSYASAWKSNGLILPDYFDILFDHSPVPSNDKKYLRDIKYAFKMDAFKSRRSFLTSVKITVFRKKLYCRLLLPLRTVKLLIEYILKHKIFNL